MVDRRVHVQPLLFRLLAGNDDVDQVAAAQTLVGDAQQSVRIRRQIDADDVGFLVDDMVDEAGVLMRETVVVLPPDVRGEQDVERGDRSPPGDAVAHLEPFGVLVEHRIDNVDECLVAGEQPVSPGQQIAFQPALADVFGEDFHDPAIGGEVVVVIKAFGHPGPVGDFEQRAQPVGIDFVRAEDAEIVAVVAHHIAQESAHHPRRFRHYRARLRHIHGVGGEVRQTQIAQQQTAVGMRIGAHAARTLRRQCGQFGEQPAIGIEQFLRPV